MPERDFSDNKKEFTDNSDVFCFLNIYKPRGITSFDVIYKLRKHLKIKKNYLFLFYVYECFMCMYVWALHVGLVYVKIKRRHWVP